MQSVGDDGGAGPSHEIGALHAVLAPIQYLQEARTYAIAGEGADVGTIRAGYPVGDPRGIASEVGYLPGVAGSSCGGRGAGRHVC